jgi:hypothetical protein
MSALAATSAKNSALCHCVQLIEFRNHFEIIGQLLRIVRNSTSHFIE